MRSGRITKAVGVAVAFVLALSGCAGAGGGSAPTSAPPVRAGGAATVAEVNAFSSFNPNTASGNVDVNTKVSYATHSGFFYIDNELNIVRNDKFGRMEKTSEDPLTVKYTVNEGVKWSDGTPVTAADLLLQWAAFSGYYDDADPEARTGTSYFSSAGGPGGLALTGFPELGSDGRSMTVTYSRPFPDWETALGGPGIDIPAHVLAAKAGLRDTNAFIDLLKGMPRGDSRAPRPADPQLQALSALWNTGFDATALPADPSLYLSNGPFIVKDINQDQSLTMVKNKDYNWGPEAKLDEITVRYIGSAAAQVQALRDGEVDIISPRASADTVEQLQALEGQGVTVDRGSQLAYEHLDLNFSGPFADKSVREAFLKTVPRQDIVDKIVKKLDPNAKPLDSQILLPDHAAYAEAVRENGSSAYRAPDIEGARKLLNGATPEIRIMYNNENPNEVDAYTLIREAASEAGFRIADGGLGKSEWAPALGKGGYDAAIFGWSNAGVGVSGIAQVFRSGSDSNYNQFSNPEADKLMDELAVTTDRGKQDAIIAKIDKLVWESAYGLPLYQSVGVNAYSDRVTGVRYMPNQAGVWWNFWEWARTQPAEALR